MSLVQTQIQSPVGPLRAAANDDGLCLLEFDDPSRLDPQLATLTRLLGTEPVPGTNSYLDHLQQKLEAYFAGQLFAFDIPLVVPGTPFQQRVWNALQQIPYGATRSYTQLAQAVGSPTATRAVGHANGQNRLAIIIPCHRVIARGGSLGGYGGGLDRKRFLLDLERGHAPGRLPFAETP